MAANDVWVLGANMTKFGRHEDKDVVDLAAIASLAALKDGGVTIQDMDVLAAGSMFNGTSGIAQQIQKQIGQTGIPAFNVINACATGATAVRTVYLSIKAGEAEMGLAVGTESMGKMGLLGASGPGSGKKEFAPSGRDGRVMPTEGHLGTFTMPGVFAQAGMEYLFEHDDVTVEHFYKISEKNHWHSTLNPLSQYRKEFTIDEIKAAPMISYPNTMPMCSPNTDGAAAVVLVSEERLRSMPIEVQRRAVKISASVLQTDPWVETGAALPDVNTCTRNAAKKAYEIAGVDPQDLDLVELHDCFATAELLHYDNLGLCEPGGAGKFLDERGPYRDGKIPVNVSGGLESKGHPIAATGVAGVYEITTHLRGEAGDRQIEGAKVGLTHVIGLGSTCGIHILEKASL
jgi:acetyl-CoA acyltransferase